MEFTATDIVAICRPGAPGAAAAAIVARAALQAGRWQVFHTRNPLRQVRCVATGCHGSVLRIGAPQNSAKPLPRPWNYSTSLLHSPPVSVFRNKLIFAVDLEK